MNTKIVAAVCALAVTSAATLVAQQSFIPAPSGVRRAESLLSQTDAREMRVIGHVIDVRRQRVAYARVQLRNLMLGVVEQETTADGNGEYQFTIMTAGTYAVEMVVVDGHIIALSNAGTVGRGQTLQTVVVLPGRWDATSGRFVMEQPIRNYFGMSAQATMTAATLQLATDLNIATNDPGEPVSP